MKANIHGGDIFTYQEEYGREPVDFSANTNPFGMPEAAKEAIVAAIGDADKYPDPHCRALCAAIAGHEGVPQGYVLCGNGAADLIFRLVLAKKPRRALVTAPAFSEYEDALRLAGCEVQHYRLAEEQDFRIQPDILDTLTPDVDMVFLCEPNNPTGVTTKPELLRQIVRHCGKNGILLVVDECFNGFLPLPEEQSCRSYLTEQENLVILKAFTKLYGMAGVRLGYLLCGNQDLIRQIAGAGQPWAVSSLAQAAGIAALGDKDYLDCTLASFSQERKRLRDALTQAGMQVYPSEANYLFFRSPDPMLHQKLRERGVMIRDCSAYEGLSKGYYRVAVRRAEENQRLIEAIQETRGE